jgi:hypothetical protein
MNPLTRLASCFHKITDPRKPRGVRHPYHSLCTLVFVGLLAQITDMAVLRRWAKRHWKQIKKPMGFTRNTPPSATCISRSLAKLSLDEFRKTFADFIEPFLNEPTMLVAAVDGKTAKQSFDDNGDPEILIDVFIHDLKLSVTQYVVGKHKTNEPGCFKEHLPEILEHFPQLRIFTGDAIYLQKPLLEVMQQYHCDYVFQVKDNQPEVLDAMRQMFSDERIAQDKPLTQTQVDKKRGLLLSGNSGWKQRMPIG